MAQVYLNEVLQTVNLKLLDKSQIFTDPETQDFRTKTITPLMVACIVGNMRTVRTLVESAK